MLSAAEPTTDEAVTTVEATTEALFGQLHDPACAGSVRRRIRSAIIELNLPFATRLAHRFANRGQPTEDLEQIAALALVKAVDAFDPTKGSTFFAFAVPTITGEIKRHFRDHGWDMRIPRRLQERHHDLRRAGAELAQRLQRSPGIAELAQELGISTQEAQAGIAAGWAYNLDSLNRALMPGEDSCERQDLLGDEDAALVSVCDRLTLAALVRLLPERQRYVLAQYFFGNRTQDQIARHLHVSQMQVSRLLTRTLEQLRGRLLGGEVDRLGHAEEPRLRVSTYAASADTLIVLIRGELDEAGAARMRDGLVDAAVRHRPRRVVVDARHADFQAPAAIRALVDGHRACGHVGALLNVVNLAEETYRLLCRLGVNRLFGCRPLPHASAPQPSPSLGQDGRSAPVPPSGAAVTDRTVRRRTSTPVHRGDRSACTAAGLDCAGTRPAAARSLHAGPGACRRCRGSGRLRALPPSGTVRRAMRSCLDIRRRGP
jgi:RNA polymerase sigma-70 factor (sigma-B/F/G subfamily)